MIKVLGAAALAAFVVIGVGVSALAADDMHGVPKKYWDHRNPLEPTDSNLMQGKVMYEAYCVRCHGPIGLGDGPDGKLIDPPPAPLAYTLHMPASTDPFMFWSIIEGGHQFDTDMPSFSGKLSDTETWQVVLYLRSGFLEVK